MPNSDSDAHDDLSHEPVASHEHTSPHPDLAQDSVSSPSSAGDPAQLPPKARTARRKKPQDPDPPAAAGLFDQAASPEPADAEQAAAARPRSPPRRKPARASAPSQDAAASSQEAAASPPEAAEHPATGQGPAGAADTPAPQTPSAAQDVVTPESSSDQPTADGSADADASAPAAPPAASPGDLASATPTQTQDVPAAPAPTIPAPKALAPGPGRTLIISASDAALAIVNPHPIRATDRPDGYLYHLTSPNEAKLLLQSGLPCSFDDPIILTERGGIPYWMSVLAEDVDDILDGPAAVTVLRVRRRAVQNVLEADADSTRAAQAPCYLLTGVASLPSAPVAPPPLLRARPPAPNGDAQDSGPGVETAGTVKWYNPRKGFGFITPGSGGKDVFVHASTLERAGLAQLTDGQSVRMQVIQGAKGPEAASLSLA